MGSPATAAAASRLRLVSPLLPLPLLLLPLPPPPMPLGGEGKGLRRRWSVPPAKEGGDPEGGKEGAQGGLRTGPAEGRRERGTGRGEGAAAAATRDTGEGEGVKPPPEAEGEVGRTHCDYHGGEVGGKSTTKEVQPLSSQEKKSS